ncbi:MAG: hypothetical protein ABIG10_03605 [bacterium]
MPDRLEKIIDLIRKTGEKLVIYGSSEDNDFYVILALKDYEKLISGNMGVRNLTEQELADKINRDIAIWKSEQDQHDFDLNYNDFKDEHNADDALNELFKQAEEFEEEERIEEIVDNNFDSVAQILANRQEQVEEIQLDDDKVKSWSIPGDRKNNAEEIAGERRYLEEISF